MEVYDIIIEISLLCLFVFEDLFLYGVLWKVIWLGSFRLWMCRGIDVVDLIWVRMKMFFRSKVRDESNKVFKSLGKNIGFLVDEFLKSINFCLEVLEK